jgi:DNA-binding MarR family transcriptional regulator
VSPAGRRLGRGKQSLRLWLRLLSAHNLIEQHIRRNLAQHFGCTLPQFDVLAVLDYAGTPQTMSQVSRRLMVTNGNLTGVVDRLENEGLVVRAVSTRDRRVLQLSLTPRGRERFRLMAVDHERWLDGLFAGLNREALDAAAGNMHQLRDVIRARLQPSE